MIEFENHDHLTRITIRRPRKANALTREMLHDLNDAMIKARGSRGVIITGEGKIFSAGADLEQIEAADLAVDPIWETLSENVATLPGLTICALNGTLAGGAFGMALACDLRIAVPDARFFYPVLRKGVLPQPSDPKRMQALIGPSRAKMILLAGQKIDSQMALRWGLIDNITTPDGLMDHAHDLLGDVLAAPLARTRSIQNMFA